MSFLQKAHDAWHSNIDKKWEVSICPHRDCAVPQSSPMYLQKHAEIWNYSLLQWQDILSGECNFSPFEEYFKQNLDKLCLTLPWFGYGPFFMSPCLKKSNLNGRLWWARGRSWDVLTAVMWKLKAGVTVKGCSSESVVGEDAVPCC